ncbi:MAG: homocysteine S-methyltransferase family protein [Candidatus Heimdallarchaeaceae archaeon]
MNNKKSILNLIKERTVVLDGGMGSMLIDMGLEPGTPTEYWNVKYPERVQKVHQSYYEAGSDVVLTNTFGGSRMKLSAHKHGESVEKYNKEAVRLIQEICPEECYIAGDIGPSGAFLPPVGTASIEDFEENFLEQAGYLADEGVDFFFIETMVDIKEAEAAVKAARKVSNRPVFASITYQKTKRGYFTIMGNSVRECIKTLENVGVSVIGANCTISSESMVDLVPIMIKETQLPLLVKPNAGKPQLVENKTVYLKDKNDFAEDIVLMIQKGAKVVGGCCGTNPEFISKISNRVKGDKV